MENLQQVYKNLFSNDVPVCNKKISSYLKDINLTKLSMEQRELCEGKHTKKEAKDALNKMKINKTPDNDGLTK